MRAVRHLLLFLLLPVVCLARDKDATDTETTVGRTLTAAIRVQLEEFIEQQCRIQGVDARLVRALIEVESNWNPSAVSRRGALGLMQLMPKTAAGLGVEKPLDPRENIRGGIAYLKALRGRFGGDLKLMMAAYNAGESLVAESRTVPDFRETQDFVQRVSALYRKLRGKEAKPAIRLARAEKAMPPVLKASLPKLALAQAPVVSAQPGESTVAPAPSSIHAVVEHGRVVFVNY